MFDAQTLDVKPTIFSRMFDWLTSGNRTASATQVREEDFDLYAAEEALLDN